VRRLPDGSLDFLGRLDLQIKVRGFRIELGEIEAALAALPRVQDAVVLAPQEGGSRRLVACVAIEVADEAETIGHLRRLLQATLPDYMVPTSFVLLPSLPVTPNGKVDRLALEELSRRQPAPARALVPPRTPVEETVAGIWAEVLRVDRVGVHDNFFELGGHSLLATQVVSRLRGAFAIEDLPLRVLFSEPTVERLALEITQRLAADEDLEDLTRMIEELKALPELTTMSEA
jgi:acyl carrier protein